MERNDLDLMEESLAACRSFRTAKPKYITEELN